jgi:hypothetical protein
MTRDEIVQILDEALSISIFEDADEGETSDNHATGPQEGNKHPS